MGLTVQRQRIGDQQLHGSNPIARNSARTVGGQTINMRVAAVRSLAPIRRNPFVCGKEYKIMRAPPVRA